MREAVIFSSVLKKASLPVLHSAAALLRLATLEYCGTTSFFMTVLLNKKYALPYRVIDSLVRGKRGRGRCSGGLWEARRESMVGGCLPLPSWAHAYGGTLLARCVGFGLVWAGFYNPTSPRLVSLRLSMPHALINCASPNLCWHSAHSARPPRQVDHFVRFADDERQCPVVWHQALLTFVQRYKHEIRPVDLRSLRALCAKQNHYKVGCRCGRGPWGPGIIINFTGGRMYAC